MTRAIAAIIAGLASLASPALAAPAPAAPPPVALGASWVADFLANVRGGRDRGAAWLGRADLVLDTRPGLLGLDGAVAHVDLMALHGPAFSERRAGDAQTVSNIEADSALRLVEAWIEAPIGAGSRIKAGLIDLNGEFDVQQVGAFFLNSSHGIGPEFSQSGRNGPSIFPVTSLGLVAEHRAGAAAFRLGGFDPIAGGRRHPGRTTFRLPGAAGLLLAGEAEWRAGSRLLLKAGAWAYSTRFARIDDEAAPPLRAGRGAYGQVEGRIIGPPEGGGDQDGEGLVLDGWARLGVADSRVHEIGAYLGGGLVARRGAHAFGLAVAHARLGDPARSAAGGIARRRAETAIEASYAWQAASWLTVQPDLQYIVHPGWDRDLADALVVGLRLAFSWGEG